MQAALQLLFANGWGSTQVIIIKKDVANCDSAVAGFDTDIDVSEGKEKGEAGVMQWISRLPRRDYVIKCQVQNQWGIMSS